MYTKYLLIMRVRLIRLSWLLITCSVLLGWLFFRGQDGHDHSVSHRIPFPHAKHTENGLNNSRLSPQNIGLEEIAKGYVESSTRSFKGHVEYYTHNISHGKRNRPISTELQLLMNKRLPWMRLKTYLPNYYFKNDGDNDQTKYKETTLVYLYSPRSASSTTKVCLRKAVSMVGRSIGPDLSECTRSHFKHRGEYDVLMGDTAFGVCDDFAKPCAYFTMVRDPYERIVSGYSYCRRKRSNSLCRAMSPWKASINEWAIHLGSYFFQQLIFHPKFCHKFHEYYFPASIQHDIYLSIPVWFRQKVILAHMLTEQQRDILVEYCLENLDKWFAVVGIVEHYDLSLKMIETVFGIPMNEACVGIPSQNVGKYNNLLIQSEKNVTDDSRGIRKLIEKLKQDDSVSRALKADLRIYARFKEIFEQQRQSMLSSNN